MWTEYKQHKGMWKKNEITLSCNTAVPDILGEENIEKK